MVDVGDIPYFVVGSASRSENSHMAKYAKHNNLILTSLEGKHFGSGLQSETVIDKSNADESVDLLNFCPWTGRYISGIPQLF